MFKRDWLFGIAIGLGIAAGYWFFAPLATLPPTPPSERANTQYNNDAERAVDWSRSVEHAGNPPITRCDEQDADKCGERWKDSLDLNAQWVAAQAARQVAWLTAIQTLVGAFGLLALGYTIWLTNKNTKAAVDSANATAEANKISRELFVADTRPWIVVQVAIHRGIAFEADAVRLILRINCTNVGKSPAFKVSIHPDIMPSALVPAGGIERPEPAAFRDFTEGVRTTRNHPLSQTLFPNENFSRELIVSVPNERIEPVAPIGQLMMLTVFGCANYEFTGSDRVHQTGFIGLVMQVIDPDPGTVIPVRQIPGAQGADRAIVAPSPFGNSYAD